MILKMFANELLLIEVLNADEFDIVFWSSERLEDWSSACERWGRPYTTLTILQQLGSFTSLSLLCGWSIIAACEEKEESTAICGLDFFYNGFSWVFLNLDYQDNKIIQQQTILEYSTLNFIEGWCLSVLSSYS